MQKRRYTKKYISFLFAVMPKGESPRGYLISGKLAAATDWPTRRLFSSGMCN